MTAREAAIACIDARGPAGAETVFRQRADELTSDLRLEPRPSITWSQAVQPGLAIVGTTTGAEPQPITLPLRLDRARTAESDLEVARRMTTGLFQARARLLASARACPEAVVDEAAALAVGADAIGHERDAEAFAWDVAENCPACVTLLLSPSATLDLAAVLETAQRFAREMSGLPMPAVKMDIDPRLKLDEARLRVRSLRTPPVLIALGNETSAVLEIARLLVAHAAMLLDPAMMLRLLLRSSPGTTDLLPDVLRTASAPLLARALRPLLDGGFGLPDAPALVAAVLAKPLVAHLADRRVTLPGTVAVAEKDAREDALAARLRAAIVPGALLRRVGLIRGRAALWYLPEDEIARLPLDEDPLTTSAKLAPLALPVARADALLLVPNGFGRRVFAALRHALPTLCVVELDEWPPQIGQVPRGTLEVASNS